MLAKQENLFRLFMQRFFYQGYIFIVCIFCVGLVNAGDFSKI